MTRSSNREPSATSRSARCIDVTAVYPPCIPGIPSASSWVSGKEPRAMSVVTTGSLPSVARSNSSFVASALITPPPTYRTGRSASMISRTASRTCFRLPFVVGL